MSLYDPVSDHSNIKINIKSIGECGGRPIWLNLALALACIYALATLIQLIVMDGAGSPTRLIVYGLMVIVSTFYLFKPIMTAGLLATGFWMTSLLAELLGFFIFEYNAYDMHFFLAIDRYFMRLFFVPDLGISYEGTTGRIAVVLQSLLPFVIYLFSLIKYRPALKA